MKLFRTPAPLVLLLTALLAPSCSEPHHVSSPECEELGTRCHAFEERSELAADCHHLGHEGSQAMCIARREECLAVCPLIDDASGAHDDAASGDGN